MSGDLDVDRLIAEVRKRRSLWDPQRTRESKDGISTAQLWKQVSEELNVDVGECKRKWKNLRDSYRAEKKRATLRHNQQHLADEGVAGVGGTTGSPIRSKWLHYDQMSFLDEIGRLAAVAATPLPPSTPANGSGQLTGSPVRSELPRPRRRYDEAAQADDDSEEEGERLFEQFQSRVTPEAARRFSESLTVGGTTTTDSSRGSETHGDEGADDGVFPVVAGGGGMAHVNFLEDLVREEQKLMQSTRDDFKRADTTIHVGDADYNFLTSFYPLVKQMNVLQNAEFRARMSATVLDVMKSGGLHGGGSAAKRTDGLRQQQRIKREQQQQREQRQRQQQELQQQKRKLQVQQKQQQLQQQQQQMQKQQMQQMQQRFDDEQQQQQETLSWLQEVLPPEPLLSLPATPAAASASSLYPPAIQGVNQPSNTISPLTRLARKKQAEAEASRVANGEPASKVPAIASKPASGGVFDWAKWEISSPDYSLLDTSPPSDTRTTRFSAGKS